MLLMITLVLFSLFIVFHLLYMFIPLYTSRPKERVYPEKEKGISVLIPVYNETLVIENCILGILNVKYSEFEVLFINDGSIDDTLEKFHKHFSLIKASRTKEGVLNHEKVNAVYQSEKYPHIWVIDKDNGGKADALNAGIEFATKEIVITLDADCILEPNSLNEMNLAFSDDSIVAAGGLVNIVQGFKRSGTVLNPCFKIPGIIRYQVIQYLTAFYLHKTTQSLFGSITVIAGAFGAFRRSILIQADGYRKTVGEDMDITLRIQQLIGTILKDKRIVYVPGAVCYTECPASLKSLYSQRIRWQKALIDCVITYRKSMYLKMNFRVSTYLFFDSFVIGTLTAYPTIMVPFIALITTSHLRLALILLLMASTLAMMQNITTILVSRRLGHFYSLRDLISLILFIPIEVLFYRIAGLIFVALGTILYFFNKGGWSRSERIGQPILLDSEANIQVRDAVGG